MRFSTTSVLVLLLAFSTSQGRPEEEYEEYLEDEEARSGDEGALPFEEDYNQPEEDLVIPEIDPERVREVLQSKAKTRQMVNCVIDYKDNCPKELEKVNKMAPDIFRRGGRCHKCQKEDQEKLRLLLVELQRHQPGEYRRMIRGLNRA